MRHHALILAALLLTGCAGLGSANRLPALQQQADQDYAAGRYAAASEGYRELARALPTDAGVRYQLANSLARQGDSAGAVAGYREALLRDPQHARAWHNLLQVQLREALLSANEMNRTLSPQQPQASRALNLGERLLEMLGQPLDDAGREP